jgi:HTH-type transcriptional regulator, competence development regulator
MGVGDIVRQLRKKKGVGIKVLAANVKVDHTYISKIENGYVIPSEEVLTKLANYLEYDKDELMLMADRIPSDIQEILRTQPKEALGFLREQFGKKKSG